LADERGRLNAVANTVAPSLAQAGKHELSTFQELSPERVQLLGRIGDYPFGELIEIRRTANQGDFRGARDFVAQLRYHQSRCSARTDFRTPELDGEDAAAAFQQVLNFWSRHHLL